MGEGSGHFQCDAAGAGEYGGGGGTVIRGLGSSINSMVGGLDEGYHGEGTTGRSKVSTDAHGHQRP